MFLYLTCIIIINLKVQDISVPNTLQRGAQSMHQKFEMSNVNFLATYLCPDQIQDQLNRSLDQPRYIVH